MTPVKLRQNPPKRNIGKPFIGVCHQAPLVIGEKVFEIFTTHTRTGTEILCTNVNAKEFEKQTILLIFISTYG